MPSRLVIEIPRPYGVVVVPDEHGDPAQEMAGTDRADWVQGVSEAMLAGARAWCQGANLITEPTIYLDPVIVPKSDEVPF